MFGEDYFWPVSRCVCVCERVCDGVCVCLQIDQRLITVPSTGNNGLDNYIFLSSAFFQTFNELLAELGAFGVFEYFQW